MRVIVPRGDGCGSGVLVFGSDEQHGWVLTADHVTGGRHEAIVEFPNGQRFQGTVVASSRTDDVALVRIVKPLVTPCKVAEVYLAGYPAGGSYHSCAPGVRNRTIQPFLCVSAYTHTDGS